MKLPGWLLVLTACAGAPDVTPRPTAAPAAAAACPACLRVACTVAPCPQAPCPACPEPLSVVAPDWYCMDLHRTDGTISGFCYTDLTACEVNRKGALKAKAGTLTPCEPQRIAYCAGITIRISNAWQAYCARTRDNCERRRAHYAENPVSPDDQLGVCRPVLNINPHELMQAPPSMVTP